MKKTTSLCMAILLTVVWLTGCNKESGSSSQEIKVGLLFSTSGSLAITEQPCYNAAMMAIDEINDAGGVDGKQLVAVYEDYASDPATAVDKIKKLIMQDKVVATVGCYTSASRIACTPVVEENAGLLIYPTYYEGEKPSDNIIYTGCVPNQQGDVFVPWLVENVGTDFFLLGTDTVYASTINSQCKETLDEVGGTVVGEEYVPSGHTDFSATIAKIKEAQPNVIFCNLNGDSAVAFYKQYESYGLDPEIMPIASYCADENTFQALGAKTAAGHYICINYMNTIDTEANQTFLTDYRELYSDDTSQLTSTAEASYNSVYLLAEALKELGQDKYTPESIIAALEGTELDAPQGTIKFDSETNHIYCKCRIGKVNHEGLLDVIYESEDLIKPVPYK